MKGGCPQVLKIGGDLCGLRGCGGGWYQLRIWGVGSGRSLGQDCVGFVSVLTMSERSASDKMTQTVYNWGLLLLFITVILLSQ